MSISLESLKAMRAAMRKAPLYTTPAIICIHRKMLPYWVDNSAYEVILSEFPYGWRKYYDRIMNRITWRKYKRGG